MASNVLAMSCQSPFWKLPAGGLREVPVPCGRCPPCKKRRVDAWVFRLMQEEKRHKYAHFVTLTYDTDHVPISPNGFMTLDKDAFPLFMKRLRKLCPDAPLRYYACGEYGSENRRPHYHAIIFGCSDSERFFKAWSLDGVPFGSVHVGQVSGDSIAYTMKYIDKPKHYSVHGRDDRVHEFALMSKGMGENYITPAIKKYHTDDLSRNYLTVLGGHKIALPRYYRERLFTPDQLEDQRMLADEERLKREEINREEHARMFPPLVDRSTGEIISEFTYVQFVETQRKARNDSFNSKINKRKL